MTIMIYDRIYHSDSICFLWQWFALYGPQHSDQVVPKTSHSACGKVAPSVNIAELEREMSVRPCKRERNHL